MQMAKCLKCLLLLSHTFLPKQFFQRVWGVYKIVEEIPEGWRGYFSGQKLEIPGRRGAYVEFPPWWEYGYFLELHNCKLSTSCHDQLKSRKEANESGVLLYFKTFWLFQIHLSYIPKYALFEHSLPSRFPVFTKFIPAFYRTMSCNRRFTVVTCIHLSSILEDSENTEPCCLYGVKNCYNILFGTL